MRLRRETGDYSIKITYDETDGNVAGKINKGLKAEDLIGAIGTYVTDEVGPIYFIIDNAEDGVDNETPIVTMSTTYDGAVFSGLVYDSVTGELTVGTANAGTE